MRMTVSISFLVDLPLSTWKHVFRDLHPMLNILENVHIFDITEAKFIRRFVHAL